MCNKIKISTTINNKNVKPIEQNTNLMMLVKYVVIEQNTNSMMLVKYVVSPLSNLLSSQESVGVYLIKKLQSKRK